ncbi:putative membrane protein [Vibrio parahaemolyticus VPTS-2010]|uniref:Polysaccharide biosynthesis protein n=1 Tax=Vibrio parahaemolyticus TaxID=670 RepID=A0A7M1WD70_VIBPH|nr:putative membrane protein [Vibrio parahaemolyticus VPTS-2010]OUJ31334.1 hypothetical protein BTR13_10365 [Vibrio parahaemolyticus]QOS24921.1 hypothetical protein VP351_00014 [Vibrio parahaemolyticus]
MISYLKKINNPALHYLCVNLACQAINFILMIYVMRAFSINEFSSYITLVEFILIGIGLFESTFRTFYVKDISAGNKTLFKLRCLFSNHLIVYFSYIIIIVFIALWYYQGDDIFKVWIVVVSVGVVFFTPCHSYIISSKNSSAYVLRELLIILFKSFFFVSVVHFKLQWEWLASYHIIVFLVYYIVYRRYLFLFKNAFRNKKYIFSKLKSTISRAKPFALVVMISMLYSKLDFFFAVRNLSDKDIAMYMTATKFTLPLLVISSSIYQAWLPDFANATIKKSKVVKKSVIMLLIGMAIAIAISSIFPFIDFYLFNNKYADAHDVISIFVFYIPIVFFYGTYTNYLMVNSMEDRLFYCNIVIIITCFPMYMFSDNISNFVTVRLFGETLLMILVVFSSMRVSKSNGY